MQKFDQEYRLAESTYHIKIHDGRRYFKQTESTLKFYSNIR